MKRILVVHYSQSGQLNRVVQQFVAPLEASDAIEVCYELLQPQQEYPFPWPIVRFFDTFPEAVHLDPPAMKPLKTGEDEQFDLIILAYQVWFLSPSLPVTGFLKDEKAKKILQGSRVTTVIACRNMWLLAQEEVKKLLSDAGAELVGNVALVDEVNSMASFIATPLWVLSGNKGPRWGGRIPKAGVSESDIESCDRFGARIEQVLRDGRPVDSTLLAGTNAVRVDEKLIASERLGRRSFHIWGGLIRKLGPQGSWLRIPGIMIYVVFLVTIILTFVPLSMLIKKLLSPLTKKRIAQQRAYFALPSGE